MVARTSHPWLLSGIAALAGCGMGLGFAPFNWWWIAPICLAALVVVLIRSTPKVGLLRGYLFGWGFNAVSVHWVAVLGLPVLGVFVTWLAVWYALVGLAVSLTRKTPVWGFVGAATWMAAEWASARWPFGGYGWGRLAYTSVDSPLNGLFPFISVTGVSLVVVSTGFLLAWVVNRWLLSRETRPSGHNRTAPASPTAGQTVPAPHPALRGPIVTTAAVIVVCAVTGLSLRSYDPAPDTRQVTAAVVQGNVPGRGIDALGPIYTVENNHLAETIILAAKIRTGQFTQPDFVIWPENSTASDPYSQKTTQIIDAAVDIARAPIFVGAITDGPGEDERQTVGIWWTADGATATYAKRNLVPFGEWVPFRSVMIKLVPEVRYVGAQSVPGTAPGVLDVEAGGQGLRIGDLICFEVAYDTTVDQMLIGDAATGGGAQVVMVQTSNAMFTGSDQMDQQDAITRIRAMESRREILVATTNSLAGLIDSHGNIVYEAQPRTSDARVFTVPTRTQITPAIAYRGLFDLASVLLPLLGCAVLLVRERIREGRASGQTLVGTTPDPYFPEPGSTCAHPQ